MMLQNILNILRENTKQNKESLVVFDLDSTLFDVSPRLERILLDFALFPAIQKKYPQQVSLLKNIKTLRSDWGIQRSLERVGLQDHPKEFLDLLFEHWQKNFFSNHYLQFDSLYDGALEFVKEVESAGANIAYLTGRDIERMGPGTTEVLQQWGFPLHKKAELVLKPHKSLDDAQFKTDWFIEMGRKRFEKIYFFENEPVNLIHLSQYCPHVEMIFFESTHAGKASPPENIPSIMNYIYKSGAK